MAARLMSTFLKWSQAFNIRFKIMGLVVGMVVLMGAGATGLARTALLDAAREELRQRGVSITRDLAARSTDLILTHSTFGLYRLLQDTRRSHPDVRYAFIVDPRGRVIAHTFTDGFPVELRRLPGPQPGEPYHLEVLSTEEGTLHDLSMPILDGVAGMVRVGLSERQLQGAAWEMTSGIVEVILLAAGLGIIAAYSLTVVLTRPILDLVDSTEAVSHGDLDRQAPPGPPDEIGRLIGAFNVMVERLRASRRELAAKERLREELLDRVITAQEDERRRIARELHDETSQAITSLLMGLAAVEENCEHPEAVRTRCAHLRRLAGSALEEVHRLALELRPQALDELGLVPALRRYARDFTARSEVPVDLQVLGPEEIRLPAPVETCLYRMVQEALTNVARHACATTVSAVIDLRPPVAKVVIEDDGMGFDPAAVLTRAGRGAKLGVYGMQERAALMGGTMEVQSAPGAGTSIFIKIPLQRGEGAHENEEYPHSAGGRPRGVAGGAPVAPGYAARN